MALGLTYVGISCSVNLLVTLGAASIAGWMHSHPKRLHVLRWTMAAALAALALQLLGQAIG